MSETTGNDMVTVNGHKINLDSKRSVWLGRHPNGDVLCVVFRNDECETRLVLSEEALDALIALRRSLDSDGAKWVPVSSSA